MTSWLVHADVFAKEFIHVFLVVVSHTSYHQYFFFPLTLTKKGTVYISTDLAAFVLQESFKNNLSVLLKDSLSHLGGSHTSGSCSLLALHLYIHLKHTFAWAMSQSYESLKIVIWLFRILCSFILSASKVSLERRWRQRG